MEPVFVIILLLGLAIATWRDLLVREVPDTVSLGLVAVGLLGGAVLAIHASQWMVFFNHLFGFGIGALFGCAMYYGRQWGGGDAKLLMGVGAIIGFLPGQLDLIAFLVLLVLCGAIWGVLALLYLALLRHRKVFIPAFTAHLRTPRVHRLRIGLVATAILLLIAAILLPPAQRLIIGFAMLSLYLLVYSWLLLKTAEKTIMIKKYPTNKLTEGDWLAADIVKGKKVLISQSTTGLTIQDIARIKKAGIKLVLVKEGVPFVPGFLLAALTFLLCQKLLGEGWFLQLLGW